MDEMIQKVLSMHIEYCPYTENKVKDLDTKPVLHIFDDEIDSIEFIHDYDCEKYIIWSHVAFLMAPLIKPLVIFSSSVPSFFDLNWDDRLMCLKLRFFEIFIIHAARLADCDNGTLTFHNGNYISKDQLEIIYDEEFVAQLFSFCDFLKDLRLSDSVIALYSIVVLYSPDSCCQKQPMILQKIQEKYKIYLSYQLHIQDQKPGIYELLLSMLPELQDLGKKHLHFVKEVSQGICSEAVEPLFMSEVFDGVQEEEVNQIVKKLIKRRRS